jgi:hypothetical protein
MEYYFCLTIRSVLNNGRVSEGMVHQGKREENEDGGEISVNGLYRKRILIEAH